MTPSTIAYFENELRFGESAKRHGLIHPKCQINNVKSLIGR